MRFRRLGAPLIAGGLVAVLAGCSGQSSPGQSAPVSDVPATQGAGCGPSTVNGAQVMTWCGTGTLIVSVGGEELRFDQVVCDRAMGPTDFAVSAGTTVRSPADAERAPEATGFSVFVRDAPAGEDGRFTSVAFGGNDGGVTFTSDGGKAEVTLAAGGTTGTFRGVDNSGRPVRGEFGCG